VEAMEAVEGMTSLASGAEEGPFSRRCEAVEGARC
jgi:hypothetical protein